VGVYEREGIQLPHVAPVAECAEVAPVDFESFSGQRFHAHESPFGSEVWANIAHVLPQDAVTSLISRGAEFLLDDCGAHAGILFQPFGDSALEWIELARPVSVHRTLRRRIEIFADRSPAHVEMPLDLADGPVLGPVEPVQIVDLFGGQHG
jgi:hypothetical protein